MFSVTKLCLTLYDLMEYSPPGSSVHGISQARILGWVVISFSRESSLPRNQTCISCGVSCIAVRFFTAESPGEANTVIDSGLNKYVTVVFSAHSRNEVEVEVMLDHVLYG